MNQIKENRAMWNKIVSFISAEYLLHSMDNGGSVIVLRSIIVSTILFLISLLVNILLIIDSDYQLSCAQLRHDIKDILPWYGIYFGSIYVALYSRFASQWTYLSNLYNSIKQASCSDSLNKETLAEWKAGFIEDAEFLHLAHKESFVPIIYVWCKDEAVCDKYDENTPGGKKRLNKLKNTVKERYEKIVNTYDNME
jgi:hypothetical protein